MAGEWAKRKIGSLGRVVPGEYRDAPGFCKSATLEEIRRHGYVLTPGRYVGAEAVEDDGEPFDEKMRRLVAQLREQQAEAAKLDAAIARNIRHWLQGEMLLEHNGNVIFSPKRTANGPA